MFQSLCCVNSSVELTQGVIFLFQLSSSVELTQTSLYACDVEGGYWQPMVAEMHVARIFHRGMPNGERSAGLT